MAEGFPRCLTGKEFSCKAGDVGSIPGLERYPGKENATHSIILAWEIPKAEKPDRLLSMGSQRVGHDTVTQQQTADTAPSGENTVLNKVSKVPCGSRGKTIKYTP